MVGLAYVAGPIMKAQEGVMRPLFYLFLLIAAIVYTYMAFFDLSFLTNRGRMGPGFFPRFIGVLLIISLSASMLNEARKGVLFSNSEDGQMLDAWMLIGMSIGFGVLLLFVGYLIAIPLYLGAVLTYYNRRHLMINGAITVAVPVVVYVLFGNVLNAALPHGVLW